jgi:hypothetical protein
MHICKKISAINNVIINAIFVRVFAKKNAIKNVYLNVKLTLLNFLKIKNVITLKNNLNVEINTK